MELKFHILEGTLVQYFILASFGLNYWPYINIWTNPTFLKQETQIEPIANVKPIFLIFSILDDIDYGF